MVNRDVVNQIVSLLVSYEMSVDAKELEEIMKRSQVEKEYGNKIKQIKDGRYHIRYKGTQIFKKDRNNVIDEILKIESQKGGKTLDDIATDFLDFRFTQCSNGTYGKDNYNYETFIKGTSIASKDIAKINLNDGIEWCNHCLEIKSDMKEKYFKNIRGTLNQMLQFAINNGLIDKNPIENVSIHRDHLAPQTRHSDSELVFEDSERSEVERLAYEDAECTNSALPLAIPLLFETGLRDGELCALKWKDIEPKRLHIHAEMVEQRNKSGKFLGYKYVSHTKTPAGNRVIPINPEVSEILDYIKELNLQNGFPVKPDDFIFLRNFKGKICECTTRCFETRIKKYCKKANMEVLKSQHDVRRSFATNLFNEGMNPKKIQALMGHESMEQTMNYIKQKGDNTDTLCYLNAISSKNLVNRKKCCLATKNETN